MIERRTLNEPCFPRRKSRSRAGAVLTASWNRSNGLPLEEESSTVVFARPNSDSWPIGDERLSERGLAGATPRGGRNSEHYREIADTLLCAETADIRVGVPWLAPTARIRERRARVSDPPLRFLRVSLSTVSTESLESYCEDLETLPFDAQATKILGIGRISPFERYLWTFLTALIMGVTSWRIFAAITDAARGSLTVGGGVAIMALLLFAEFSSDAYRRMSFATLLLKEIRRRRGIFPDRPNAIVAPLGPKPLSD